MRSAINRASRLGVFILSLTALATVLVGLVGRAALLGHIPAVEPDEGAFAHLFQLSIAGLFSAGSLFLVTAEWGRPWRTLRPLAVPAAAVVVAFAVLYYFEKYYPSHH